MREKGVCVFGAGSLKAALSRWTELFGFPYRIVSDEESGIMSLEMRTWLEESHTKLDPHPASRVSRHTQSGLMDEAAKRCVLRG